MYKGQIQMKLEPSREWVCDSCYRVIKSAEDGAVEWLKDKDKDAGHYKAHGFKIIHNEISSPGHPCNTCSIYRSLPGKCEAALKEFVGTDGLVTLFHFLDPNPDLEYRGPAVREVRELLEFARRVQLPRYEEARLYWPKAEADGLLEDTAWTAYRPDYLEIIIEKYRPKEGTDEEQSHLQMQQC